MQWFTKAGKKTVCTVEAVFKNQAKFVQAKEVMVSFFFQPAAPEFFVQKINANDIWLFFAGKYIHEVDKSLYLQGKCIIHDPTSEPRNASFFWHFFFLSPFFRIERSMLFLSFSPGIRFLFLPSNALHPNIRG